MEEQRECSLASLGLEYDSPNKFVEPRCGGAFLIYLIYRVVTALYFLAATTYTIIIPLSFTDHEFFVYFAYWSIIIESLCALLHAVLVIKHYVSTKDQNGDAAVCQKMSIVLKVLWVFNNIMMVTAPIVTGVYWLLPLVDQAYGKSISFLIAHLHVINTLFVLVELVVSAVPVRVLHFIYPMGLTAVYVIVSGIWGYVAFRFTFEWDFTSNAFWAVGFSIFIVFVGVPLVHLIRFALYHYACKSCVRKDENGDKPYETLE